MNKVSDGLTMVLTFQSKVGRPTGCDDAACVTVVQAYSATDPAIKGYAVCETGKREAGAPAFCVPVAVSYGDKEYLLAWQTFASEGGAGRPDFSMYLIWSTGSHDLQFPPLVQTILSAPPWQLTVQNSEHYLLATSAMRSSAIWPPWREELTVRVDFSDARAAYSAPLDKTFGYKKFSVSTTTYVNLLNTDRVEDWHLPSEQMQARYVSLLMTSMKNAIAEACRAPVDWYDAFHAGCEITKEDKAGVTRMASSLD